MGEFNWDQRALGRDLIVWETYPDHYAIFILANSGAWTVSLQYDGWPLQTVTGLQSLTAANRTATKLQFQLALGTISAPSQYAQKNRP